jgi:hypothetical protein
MIRNLCQLIAVSPMRQRYQFGLAAREKFGE